MERIVTINLSEDIIRNIADYADKEFLQKGKDISLLAFVFGGKRPALFLKRELARKMGKSFLSPRFFSIDEFMAELVSKNVPGQLIPELDACYLIYQLAGKIVPDILKGRISYAKFLPWAREILSFIEQLDLEDIDLKSLQNIQCSAQIGYDVPESINHLLENIVSLREVFHQELKGKKIFSRGLCYLLAAQYIENTPLPEFDQIFFCNFFYLHKTEEKIIRTLYSRGKAILFFQGSQDDWPVLEGISRKLSCPIQPVEKKPAEYCISYYAGFDRHSQSGIVREILKKIPNLNDTVIVSSEPEDIIPLLTEISSQVKELNVSLGYPLRRSSLYALFEHIFNAQITRKGQEYYAQDYLRAMANPLIKNLRVFPNPTITRIVVHKIEEILKGITESPVSGSLFIKLENIENLEVLYDITMEMLHGMGINVRRDELKKIVQELHEVTFISWEKINNFSEFSFALERFLDILVNKSFLSKYPLNLKVVEKLLQIQKELEKAAFSQEPLSQEEIFRIFEDVLNHEMISFSGSPLKGIQILGLFETRSLSFENVIVMGMNESILPRLKIYEPLIPREVMFNLGLNRLQREGEIQHYHFKCLISSAKNVHLIYEESKDKSKSRFLEELIWEKQKLRVESQSIPLASFRVKVLPKKLKISKNKEVIKYLQEFTYSASGIDAYLNCPLAFYYRYVLHLKEEEDLLEEPAEKDMGTFIHELLKDTFRVFLNKKPKIDRDFRDFFSQTLGEKFEKEFQRRMKADSFLIKEVVDHRMEIFMNTERTREVKKILHLEETFENKIVLGKKEYNFKAKVDRVDLMNDDSLLIIDYKTGEGKMMSRNAKTLGSLDYTREPLKNVIQSFQIPLYLHFVEEKYPGKITDAALYNLRKGDLKKFFSEKYFAQKKEIQIIAMKALESIINEILNPEIPFKADEEDTRQCDYCSFSSLCR